MYFLYLTISLIAGVLLWDNLFYSFLLLIPFLKIKNRLILIIFFCVGFLQGLYFYYPYLTLNKYINREKVIASGKIENLKGNSFILKANFLKTDKGKTIYKHKLKIKIFYYKKYFKKIFKEGDFIKAKLKLEPLQYVNPGTFNFANYYKSQGIRYISYLENKKDIITIIHNKIYNNFIFSYRKYIEHLILKNVQNHYIRGFIIALTTGNKLYLTNKNRKFLIENGISHLFSISGLHVGIFFIFTLIVLRVILYLLNIKNFYFPFILSIPFISFYIVFTGANYPAIRAGLIIIALILSLFVKRYKDSLNILFFILFLIVLISPFSFYNISLQFSFIVVFSLLFYANNKTFEGKFLNFFAVIILAFFSGLPLSVYYFSAIYPKAIISNIFAVPFFSILIIPLSIILIFMSKVPFFNLIIVKILEQLLKLVNSILHKIPDIKAIFIHSPGLVEIFCWYLIIFLIIYLIATFNKITLNIILRSVIAFLLICSISFAARKSFLKDNIIGVIDNYHNYTIFIKREKINYLLYSVKSIKNFRFKVFPVLLKYGITRLNYLIIPFYSNNSIANINNLNRFIKIDNIVTNDKRVCDVLSNKIRCFKVVEGDKVGELSVLFPPVDKYYLLSYKDSSIVFKLKKISFCYYLTKDIYEYLNYKNYLLGDLVVLYKSEIKKLPKKMILLSKRKERGFLEIFLNNLKIENFLDSYNKFSLLKILLTK